MEELAHGICARAPLFDLQGFNFMADLTAKPFHMFLEGIAKLACLFVKGTKQENKALQRKCNSIFSQICMFSGTLAKAWPRRHR